MKHSNQVTILLISLSILLRLFLLSFPSFKIDMGTWQAWALRLADIGPTNFYSPDYFSDYLPGYLYILWLLGLISKIFSSNFEILLKLSTNIFDYASAFLIFKVIQSFNRNWAKACALLYIYNPAVIFNSTIWGQVDSVVTFFMLFSAYFLFEKKDKFKWALLYAFSVITKPQSLAILIAPLVNFFKNRELKKSFITLGIFSATLFFIALPFFTKDPFFGLINQLQKASIQYPYTTLFAFNIWSFVGSWKSDSQFLSSFNYQQWGAILYLTSTILITIPLLFGSNSKNTYLIYFAQALYIFSFFLFPTRIHERYLFPLFAFLLLPLGLGRSIKILILYLSISFIHFINLWYVYYYYNWVYDNSKLGNNFLFQFIDNFQKTFAFFTLLIFILLILIYYKHAEQIIKK